MFIVCAATHVAAHTINQTPTDGRRRKAIRPPQIMNTKQKSTDQNGPNVLSRKPKAQPQKAVLIPLTKSKIPATEPNDLPARSLPIARQVAKTGESPTPVKAIASVAMITLGLSIIAMNPAKDIRMPSITSLQAPMRKIRAAAPRRLSTANAQVMLLRAAATAGVCPNATCRKAGVQARTLELIPDVNIITVMTGISIARSEASGGWTVILLLGRVSLCSIVYVLGTPKSEKSAATIKHIVKAKGGRG